MSSFAGPTGRSSGLKGTGYKQVSMPTMSPEQSQLFSQLIGGAGQGLGGGGLDYLSKLAAGGSPEMWEQLEAPAMRQFGGLTGQLASRFSGMGSGARRSSGFQNVMGEAGADLSERLAGQRMGLQQQAIRDLMGLSQSLLGQKTFESALIPKEMPFWKQLLGSAIPGLAQGASGFGGMAGLMSLYPKAFGMG